MRTNARRKGIAPVIGVVAIVALLVGLAGGTVASPFLLGTPASINYKPTSETKQFWVYQNTASFNDSAIGIPHDQFTPSTLVVNQGDTVIIHFYNTEDTPEHHNFVMTGVYSVNVDLGAGEHQDITFTASHAGVFIFLCTFHQPTMRGQLIVLPTTN